ncbi:MAG TPA: ribosomal RNA small subunit methyltransferase A [Desulfobulbaceae bacterium]|nr:ribosomal RNA small subunit methyltransferase A [Desulfobulbaceae bacterium]
MSKYGNSSTYDTLKNNKLAPSKRFGQNFLVNRHTAEAIVRAGNVRPTDIIMEVGVGLGALTVPLAGAAHHVYGFEIDSGIIRFHEEEGDLPANVTLIHQDILAADFTEVAARCGGKLKIMANLPYSISNPFIFKLIDNASLIESATIMLQKEVAERLMAEPATKAYGVPTVLLASRATVKKMMTLGPGEFHPRPKIDSVVVTIDFTAKKDAFPEYDFQLFKQIVRTTFNQRRKTILNTLARAAVLTDAVEDKSAAKEICQLAIAEAHLSPQARPETLTVVDFIALTGELGLRLG